MVAHNRALVQFWYRYWPRQPNMTPTASGNCLSLSDYFPETCNAISASRQRHRNQDAPDSKSGGVTPVWVQVPPSVLSSIRTYDNFDGNAQVNLWRISQRIRHNDGITDNERLSKYSPIQNSSRSGRWDYFLYHSSFDASVPGYTVAGRAFNRSKNSLRKSSSTLGVRTAALNSSQGFQPSPCS